MKVLIISHNAISTTNNMGKTLYSLFSEFDKEELCQLFVHPMMPDVDVCSSYYCITDEDILHSLYSFKLPGRVVDKTILSGVQKNEVYIPQEISELVRTNNSAPIKRLLRDMIWKISKWDNKKLNNWLEKEKPTCIFLAPGYAKFIYDVALIISKKLNIPIITYICDDYYFVKKPRKLLDTIQYNLLHRKMEYYFNKTKYLVAINDEINKLYSDKFGLAATTIMTGTSFENTTIYKKTSKPCLISYFGNIRCNRYISLIEVGKVIDEINHEHNTEFKLKIYTQEEKEVLEQFLAIEAVEICDFVKGIEFENKMMESDFLLHVEAFDKENMDLVKNSISTKIADSLGVGIPLIAYGPQQIASMKYLYDNRCAFCASDKNDLKILLTKLFLSDRQVCETVINNAAKCAKRNHNSRLNSNKLRDVLNVKKNNEYID